MVIIKITEQIEMTTTPELLIPLLIHTIPSEELNKLASLVERGASAGELYDWVSEAGSFQGSRAFPVALGFVKALVSSPSPKSIVAELMVAMAGERVVPVTGNGHMFREINDEEITQTAVIAQIIGNPRGRVSVIKKTVATRQGATATLWCEACRRSACYHVAVANA